jgi:xanthine dehydrogenase YagR molybdenum-binding subunit
VADGPLTAFGPSPRYPFKDNRIVHHGQHVAMVVAQTREQAVAAEQLIEIEYAETTPLLGIDDPEAPVMHNPWGMDAERGDVASALAAAAVTYDQAFTIAAETNNPIGLFATVARWENGHLTIHDATQWPMAERRSLATIFDVPEDHVRVLVPHLGGGFGAGLRTSPHTVLTALAAKTLERPVKLVLTRPQMFTSIGHRPQNTQRVRLGASREGKLLAIDHEGASTVGIEEFNVEPITMGTPAAYACAHVATRDLMVGLNIPNPGAMRAPGTSEGNFGIESALDELSYELDIDPVELRLRNFADVHPQSGLPWSSNALRECYRVGAERFGWSRRNPEVRSMREGNWLIGYGMAGVSFHWYQTPCQVSISLDRDGNAHVRSAATDIGTGTYTVATQLTAELLGLRVDQVRVEIGDSDLPPAPQSGGSGLAVSLSAAIYDAAGHMLRMFVDHVAADERSPLRGVKVDDVSVEDGRIHLTDDPSIGESYTDILIRHGLTNLVAEGDVSPATGAAGMAPAGAFAARFVEVRIDEDLGLLRIARLVTAVDGGRILNEKTARSQITGATVMGIGMTMHEETVFDPSGRIANANFGDYLIPVNADIPDLDVVFVGEPDRFGPVGIKGLGEVGVVGVAAAIANAVYHATGRRIRSLPITIEKLL